MSSSSYDELHMVTDMVRAIHPELAAFPTYEPGKYKLTWEPRPWDFGTNRAACTVIGLDLCNLHTFDLADPNWYCEFATQNNDKLMPNERLLGELKMLEELEKMTIKIVKFQKFNPIVRFERGSDHIGSPLILKLHVSCALKPVEPVEPTWQAEFSIFQKRFAALWSRTDDYPFHWETRILLTKDQSHKWKQHESCAVIFNKFKKSYTAWLESQDEHLHTE